MIKLALFRGDCRFNEDLRYLEIDEDTWLCKMSEPKKKSLCKSNEFHCAR